MPETKKLALEALAERRMNRPEKVDNSSLYAGSSMYYYCKSCGWPSDVLPETHTQAPKQYCGECQALKEKGWI